MYYGFDCDQIMMTGSIEQESGPAIYRLARGRIYEAKKSSLPFQFSYRESDGKALYDFYSGDCLMSLRLVATLRDAGVDNLQTFQAVLTERTSGTVRTDFCVVNVMGLVAAADMARSDGLALGNSQVFTKLAIDDAKASELLMFRLAESESEIIVHEHVAIRVRGGEFNGLVLKPVSNSGQE